jgi:hypothetical protein
MLAHVHIMKTAGQTVRGILRQSFGCQHCDLLPREATASDFMWAQRFYPRLKSIAGHGVLPHKNFEAAGRKLSYFTFLRDPVQRCVSHYQFSRTKFRKYPSFQKWLHDYADYQTRVLCGTRDASRAIEILEDRMTFVGLVEQFNESLILWQDSLPDQQLNLCYQAVNVAPDNRIKQQLLADPATVLLIQEMHQHDTAVYRYAKNIIYRRQVQRFGSGLKSAVAEFESQLPGPTILSFEQMVATAKRDVLYKPLTRFLRHVG